MQGLPYPVAMPEACPDERQEVERHGALEYEPVSRPEPKAKSDAGPDSTRQIRRLPERILVAAHQACDLGALDVAASLLSIMEVVLQQQPPGGSLSAHRRAVEGLVAAHERLWNLRRRDHTEPDRP